MDVIIRLLEEGIALQGLSEIALCSSYRHVLIMRRQVYMELL